MYDYYLGGKNHFAVDREAADKIIAIDPETPLVARRNREFLGRAVRFLAAEAGIRQFLDIGTGLPTAGNTHEVAQGIAPESRIVYVDDDDAVLAHARALLASHPAGACAYIDADLRDTGAILEEAARTLDFSQPVAVMLIAILHFIPDEAGPWGIVAQLMDAMAPGSYLAVSHVSPSNKTADQQADVSQVYARTSAGGVYQRSMVDVGRFFTGLSLVNPGLTEVSAWRPEQEKQPTKWVFYGGVGRKEPVNG
jgi:trans-aconitate methyltransferase